jgi:hypothetical protein
VQRLAAKPTQIVVQKPMTENSIYEILYIVWSSDVEPNVSLGSVEETNFLENGTSVIDTVDTLL